MVILISLILTFFSMPSFGQDSFVKEVVVNCDLQEICDEYYSKFEDLAGRRYRARELRDQVRFKALDPSINGLYYKVEDEKLYFDLRIKPKVNAVNFNFDNDEGSINLKSIIPLKEGNYFEDGLLEASYNKSIQHLKENGFLDSQVNMKLVEHGEFVDVTFDVNLGSFSKVREITINSGNIWFDNYVRNSFRSITGKIWDKENIHLKIDSLRKEIFELGFYESSIKIVDTKISQKGDVTIDLDAFAGSRYAFSFSNHLSFTKQELVKEIRGSIKSQGVRFNSNDFKESVLNMYKSFGFYNTEVSFFERRGVDKYEVPFVHIYFDVKEGNKVYISSLKFDGNGHFTNDYLTSLYHKSGTGLSRAGYLDEEYLEKFREIIKKEYLSNGYLFVEIVEPRVVFNKIRNRADVSFLIIERQQTILKKINVNGLNEELNKIVISDMLNKEEQPLDIINLERDLNRSLDTVRENGYFFAEFKSKDPKKLITYTNNFREAQINLDLNSGLRTEFESLVVTGNVATKFEVIEREVPFIRGDFVTPRTIDELEKDLKSLGLFSVVRITPYVSSVDEEKKVSKINLLIQLKEKDFGLAEVAPGYRTDLGVKFSGSVNYNNLMGMNRTLNVKVLGNLRTDLSVLDERREQEGNRLIEGQVKLSYIEPYLFYGLFGTRLEGKVTATAQRKRYEAFDADIVRFAPSLTKVFNRHFSTSLKYQLEYIDQYDATREIDDDSFQIGSIIPSISIDYRDNPLNPKNGNYLLLSWEFANKFFLSNDDDDLKINFNKFVLRNRYYKSFGDSFVIATSIAGGIETNFATDETGEFDDNGDSILVGYIPSLKVFRLDGIDQVRGFSSDEINRIEDGTPIGEVVVDDEAYFVNFKFEPRYYVNDNLVIGAFFDAGGLFVNNFKPLRLRTAVGPTLKFVTPVGSIDFDYGVKLQRRIHEDTGKESFGRFHLNIGFF